LGQNNLIRGDDLFVPHIQHVRKWKIASL